MATSAFKSTSRRTPIGSSSSEDSGSASRSHRRSRSLSRFSRPVVASEPFRDEYTPNGPKGKFVNTVRGSGDYAEISLDDLALELFSSRNQTESDGGVAERAEREGRSVSRRGGGGSGPEIGRWASDTASSRRRGRSVSRSGGGDTKTYVASSGTGGGGKNVTPFEPGSRRRRSLSVARYHVSDSESELDNSQNPSNRAIVKGPIRGRSQVPSSRKVTAISNQQPGISVKQKDQSLHDGYSSHSSALTDDEPKIVRTGKNGFEKTIRAVYAEKKTDLHKEDAVNSGLYEAMRKELRYAVEEIRSELNQVGKPEVLRDISAMRKNYATKLDQSEKRKQDLLNEILLEEQRGQELSKIVRDLLPDPKTSVAPKPSRARKRSNDKTRASRTLSEEAERYFQDFISNIEDTDISSFDGERSDGSSTIGSTRKDRDSSLRGEAESYQTPALSISCPVEIEGVLLPWLKWETSPDGSSSSKIKGQTPVTPKTLKWDSDKFIQDGISTIDPNDRSSSSYGSWSPGSLNSCPSNVRENNQVPHCDMDEYLKLGNRDEVLFEMYKERNRINSGGLLLCDSVF